ncbi:MAG: CDP-2,3-bis-(O-geranylgeranyl)-sn-glycerol synthase [Acidilobaceae archaeon]|nr:CDP-2,3-bis-(O-geranylgeranyl)-sn-glycerol synthase [Acidilobaceae archaeon]
MAVVGDLIEGLLLLLPAMVANATPVVAGGRTPVDMGLTFLDGRRLLGKGKTWEGLFAGIAAGTAAGALLSLYRPELLFIGFGVSVGAMTGDLVASFIKRRFNMESGAPAPVLDQLNFYVGAVVALYLMGYQFTFSLLVILAIVSGSLHLLTNIIAYILGWKEHPW